MEFQASCQNRIYELLAEYGSYTRIERVAKDLGRPGPSAQTLGKIVSGQCAGSLRTYMGLMTLPDKPPVAEYGQASVAGKGSRMIEKKKKQLRVNHRYDGEIMSIGHWEPLNARLANWARSAQTLRQKALRWEYLLCCGYAPDEKSNRPAFGGEIEHLSHAEFVKKWGVSYATLKRWHKEVEKISTEIKQEWT